MAQPSAVQKKAFFEGLGKPGSYHYFASGPNLGSSWSWDTALAGGYTPAQMDGFVAKTETAYKAHKKTSKATPAAAAAPGFDPPGMGGACAKTAAKAVVSAASEIKTALMAGYHNSVGLLGLKVLDGTVKVIDAAPGLAAKIQKLMVVVGDQTGQGSVEWKALAAMRQHLEGLHVMNNALGTAQKLSSGVGMPPGEMLKQYTVYRNAMSLRYTQMSVHVDALEELFPGMGKPLLKQMADWSDEITGKMDDVIWSTFAEVSADVSLFDQWLLLVPEMDIQQAAAMLPQLRHQVDLFRSELGSMFENHEDFLKTLRGTEFLNKIGTVGTEIVGEIDAKLLSLSTLDGWLGSPGVLTPDGFIHQVADFDQFVAQINQYEKAVQNAYASGFVSKPTIFPAHQLDQVEQAWEEAKLIAAQQLPTPTPSAGAVTEALSADQIVMIKTAGTDELNPMVQAKLTQDGELPSLTYFMSKPQKQDYLLMQPDDFQGMVYKASVVDPVTGEKVLFENISGLGMAKVKYAAKNGSPPPAATAHGAGMKTSIDEALAASVKTPAQTAGGINPVTGLSQVLVDAPFDAPKWWADPMTDDQANFIEILVTKHGLEPALKDAGWYFEAQNGTLTKGKATLMIDLLKEVEEEVTVDNVISVLKYQDPFAELGLSPEMVAEQLLEEAAQAADAVPMPTVSGQKAVTSAAPDNPVWDEAHQFTYKGDGQSKWGGAHRKWWFQDEAGNDWMLKHGEDFRSQGELAAHKIAHVAGFDIPEARVAALRVDGSTQKGFMQRMLRKDDVVGEIGAVGDVTDMPDEVLQQLQEHQVLDWLIGNHDSHKGNFMILKDGRVVAVDKGQAFKFYGKDKLSVDYAPPGNHGEVVYNRMWAAYRRGEVDVDLNAIEDALARVEAMSEEQLRDLVNEYAVGRFRVGGNDRSLASLGSTTAKSADELLDQVIARKRNIRHDFEEFYQGHAAARGETWTPSWKKAPANITSAKPKVISAHDVLTPIDDDFAVALQRVGTNGKAVYVAGTDVERGQILFDVVKDPTGNLKIRMNMYLRPDADRKMSALLQSEGGGQITKQVASAEGVVDDVPAAVWVHQSWVSAAQNAAKTINTHISSADFKFTQATLDTAKSQLDLIRSDPKILRWVVDEGLSDVAEVKAKYGADVFEISAAELKEITGSISTEAGILQEIGELAERKTRERVAMEYHQTLFNIGIEGNKGTLASKIPIVPDFDVGSYYKGVRQKAEALYRKSTKSKAVVVEVAEPESVFTKGSLTSERFATRAVAESADVTDTIGIDKGWTSSIAESGTKQARGASVVNGKKVEVAYRSHSTHEATFKGWTEVVMDVNAKNISADDVAALHRFVTDRLGIDARLANSTDMELTYWRVVQGTYRFSEEGAVSGTAWSRALTAADGNLSKMGPNATAQQEIDAIRSAWRSEFGTQVDAADVLPNHNHLLFPDAPEFGWGFWERPELTDSAMKAFEGKKLAHRINGTLGRKHFSPVSGSGLLAQQERLRHGVGSAAASAGSDLNTGGASGFFTRMQTLNDSNSGDHVIINPARRGRRLLDYNASTDTFGRLSNRAGGSTIDPVKMAGRSRYSSNEFMLRDVTSHADDVEIEFFGNAQEHQAVLDMLRARGVTHVRDVPIEERYVYRSHDRGTYQTNFFKKYVDVTERLRRDVTNLVTSTGRAVSQAALQMGNVVASRVRFTKTGSVSKKLTAGRTEYVRVGLGSGKFDASAGEWVYVRYHVSENIISVPEDVVDWSSVQSSAAPFKLGRGFLDKPSGVDPGGKYAVVVDLAPFGIDIKTMASGNRKRFIAGFLKATESGSDTALAEVVQRFGGTWVP